MKTVSIFKNGQNRAVRLPKGMDFPGVNELEIIQDGNGVILRPARPSWVSLSELERTDSGFLEDRKDVISDEGRFIL